MDNGCTFEFLGGYILIVFNNKFVFNTQTISAFWTSVAMFCKQHDCKKIISEGSAFYDKLSMVETFESANAAGKNITGFSYACVVADYAPSEKTDFFKTVAQNRGVRIEFFKDRRDALQWLGVSVTSA